METNFSVSLMAEGYAPRITSDVFENVTGQNEARSSLDFFITSHDPTTPFPTLAFVGGPGLGKTFFSSKVAKALNRNFIVVNCANVKTADEFTNIVLKEIFEANRPATVLMDEAQALTDQVTTILLTFLNPTDDHANTFLFQGIKIKWDMTLINMIFATTNIEKMFDPLRGRCQEIYFYPYSDEDMYKIVKEYLPDINLLCTKKDLALTCRSRARGAYVFSTNIRRFLRKTNSKEFTQENLNELKATLSILPMGLLRKEVSLLKVVMDCGPISAANIAIKLMVNQSNVEEDIEIRLRELSLIESSTRGRIITEAGKAYLKQYQL